MADEGELLDHTVLHVASQRTLLAAVERVLHLGDVKDSILFPGRDTIHFSNDYMLWWVLCPYGSFELLYQWGCGVTFSWFHMEKNRSSIICWNVSEEGWQEQYNKHDMRTLFRGRFNVICVKWVCVDVRVVHPYH